MSNLQTPNHGHCRSLKYSSHCKISSFSLLGASQSQQQSLLQGVPSLQWSPPPMPELTSTDTSLYFTPYCTSMPSYQVSLLWLPQSTTRKTKHWIVSCIKADKLSAEPHHLRIQGQIPWCSFQSCLQYILDFPSGPLHPIQDTYQLLRDSIRSDLLRGCH